MDIIGLLAANGFVDLGTFHPEITAAEAAQRLVAELGCELWGRADSLTVNPTTAKPLNTYAGNYGLEQLPLHTDLAHWYVPPHYLMLRCVVGDPAVATLMLHHREALGGLPAAVVDRALFRPRRRMEGQMFLVRLCHRGIFRWDQLFLKPDNYEAWQVRAVLVDRPTPRRVAAITLDRPGRTILIDNWTTLHGRSAVGRMPTSRRIERTYFSGERDDEQDAS